MNQIHFCSSSRGLASLGIKGSGHMPGVVHTKKGATTHELVNTATVARVNAN
jgi:hypothetical protein